MVQRLRILIKRGLVWTVIRLRGSLGRLIRVCVLLRGYRWRLRSSVGVSRLLRRTVGYGGSLRHLVGVSRLLRWSVGVDWWRLRGTVRVRRLLWRLVGQGRALRLLVGVGGFLGSKVGVILSDVNTVFWCWGPDNWSLRDIIRARWWGQEI